MHRSYRYRKSTHTRRERPSSPRLYPPPPPPPVDGGLDRATCLGLVLGGIARRSVYGGLDRRPAYVGLIDALVLGVVLGMVESAGVDAPVAQRSSFGLLFKKRLRHRYVKKQVRLYIKLEI